MMFVEAPIVSEARAIALARGNMEAYKTLPRTHIGEIVYLKNIWDGEGEVPENSYSYWIGNGDYLNYEFEYINKKEGDILNSVIKVIDIYYL